MKVEEKIVIYGRNTVLESLNSANPVSEIYIYAQIEKGDKEKFLRLAEEKAVKVRFCERAELLKITGTEKNQGVAGILKKFDVLNLRDGVQAVSEARKPRLVIVLDSLGDPQNLGSVLRTAGAASVDMVVMNDANSCPISGTVFKVSAGGIFHVPVCVCNISQYIDRLKELGFWIYGFETGGDKIYNRTDMKGDLALVFGSEGEGLRDLTRKKCDFLLKIPIPGRVSSLNVSVSAALGIYEVLRQRQI